MGKLSSVHADLAQFAAEGAFSSVGSGPWLNIGGAEFNVVVWGSFVGSLSGEYSFDGGTVAMPVIGADGSEFVLTSPGAWLLKQPEPGVLFRLRCTAITAGTASWRVSL
jgi:hypothetical protein